MRRSTGRLGRVLAGIVAGACLGTALSACRDGQSASVAPDEAVVTKVIDGDTVELDFAGRRERVRLLGIDAPESVHPILPVQCFGPEASAALTALLPAGSTVRVVRDIEARDRYDRLLLYLYRADDDLFVNRWLVANGLADTAFYEPNTALADELTRARTDARATTAGLWSHCDGPDQPLDPLD